MYHRSYLQGLSEEFHLLSSRIERCEELTQQAAQQAVQQAHAHVSHMMCALAQRVDQLALTVAALLAITLSGHPVHSLSHPVPSSAPGIRSPIPGAPVADLAVGASTPDGESAAMAGTRPVPTPITSTSRVLSSDGPLSVVEAAAPVCVEVLPEEMLPASGGLCSLQSSVRAPQTYRGGRAFEFPVDSPMVGSLCTGLPSSAPGGNTTMPEVLRVRHGDGEIARRSAIHRKLIAAWEGRQTIDAASVSSAFVPNDNREESTRTLWSAPPFCIDVVSAVDALIVDRVMDSDSEEDKAGRPRKKAKKKARKKKKRRGKW